MTPTDNEDARRNPSREKLDANLMEPAESTSDKHTFGGSWTVTKLKALDQYLPAFTTALKNQQFRLLYIDAFAGTGRCDIKLHDQTKTIAGSARRALSTVPTFDGFRFIELKKRKLAALNALKSEYSDRDIEIIHDDANTALRTLCDRYDWRNTRAVLFLDPYGLHVEWPTLEAIAKTKAIDVWYLFPYAGLYRQASKDARFLDSSKEDAITRLLGTDEWRHAFYAAKRQPDMFDAEISDERLANHGQMLDYVSNRLKSIFPDVCEPKVLFQSGTSKCPSGAPLFALYFAASNPDPKARGLAMRIARHVLKTL